MINLTDAAEDVADEALIKAIKRMNDPEEEGNRPDSCSEGSDDEEIGFNPVNTVVDKDMERIQNDTALRHHLKIGSSFTGPKGVRQDYKFHQQQERARSEEKRILNNEKLSKAAMSSGWMERTIAEESFDDDFMKKYRDQRLQELRAASNHTNFGSVVELNQSSFVACIESERVNTKVLVHLYDNSDSASRLVNDFFLRLAPLYKSQKFCRIPALTADPNFDLIGLPAVLVYSGGDLEISLIRVTDEIPGWKQTGRCSLQDFEEYLIIQGVLDENDREECHVSEDSDSEDF